MLFRLRRRRCDMTLMIIPRGTAAMQDFMQNEWAPTWPADEDELAFRVNYGFGFDHVVPWHFISHVVLLVGCLGLEC